MILAREQERPVKKERTGKTRKGAAGFVLSKEDEQLFETLRRLRAEIARKEGVPPYIVFSDKTLSHMCVIRPRNRNEMLSVAGVGEFKYDKYGEAFLHCVADFEREQVGLTDFEGPEFWSMEYGEPQDFENF